MANDGLSKLIDQYGTPIAQWEIDRLKEEVAGPSAFSARPPFAGHLAFDIHPARLGSVIRAADNGSTRDWFIIAEEIEELFPHYLAALSKRKRQVSLLPITVNAAEDFADGEKHADYVRRWLNKKVLENAMFHICDGIGKGYSVNEIIWEGTPKGFTPAEICWRNQRDFEVSWEDGETLWLRDMANLVPLQPHKFLVHKHPLKSGNPVRNGLTRAVAWLWMYSTFTLKDWALFVQGYGLPVRVGKYGPGASAGDKRTLWRAVRSIGGDMAAIIPSSMTMEFVEAKTNEGAKLFTDRANWLNFEVSKLVLGGVAGLDAVSGSHAVGQEHRAAEQDVEKFDARLLADSVNRQIIPAMIAFSFGPQDEYPTVKIGEDEKPPMSDVIAAIADLGPLGFKAKAQEIRDRLQLTKPEGDDEVIGVPPPAPAVPGALNPDGTPLVKEDVKIKANPHPEINPNSDTRALMTHEAYRELRGARQARHGGLLGRLMTTHAPAVMPVMEALEDRLHREAGAALATMTAKVRQCMEQVVEEGGGLTDFMERLHKLELDEKAFAVAMAQGMTLAHLAGQAELLDELKPQS